MDRITIRGIRAYGRHGNNPGERDDPQPFDIDVRIALDLERAKISDALEDTLDYAALHATIVSLVEHESYNLLERLAGRLLDALLRDERIARAEVTIAKPGILDGATPSVTLTKNGARYRGTP
jgi:dihydroneopterin aldolase